MPRTCRRLSLLLALVLAPGGLAGQGAAPSFGCREAPQRQFDFWVGRWDVTVGSNAAGTNEITLEEDGCLLHEPQSACWLLCHPWNLPHGPDSVQSS